MIQKIAMARRRASVLTGHCEHGRQKVRALEGSTCKHSNEPLQTLEK